MMETGMRPCLSGKEELGPGWKTSLLSPRPSHKSNPLPQTPSTNQPGDRPGPEPSTATAASWPSSSGQVSPHTSRLELVLEGPQGPGFQLWAAEYLAPPGDGCPSLPPQQALEPPESCLGPGWSSPPTVSRKCPQSHLILAYFLPSWLPRRWRTEPGPSRRLLESQEGALLADKHASPQFPPDK